ncbi:MAG: ROK family protein [Acidobacteriia bacterium]|nr:ROK family protein [Terriglobia bacterium]
MRHVLGIDIGGTKIAAGRVYGNAEVGETLVVPTLAQEPLEVSLGQLWKAIESLLTAETGAIGICAPGPLNPKTGVVINPSNLPHWHNVGLAAMVRDKYGLPCQVENDANAAALAEWMFGAAQGYASVFYATLSTGIGAGIILDGKIYHGKNGAAAEGGHVTIDYRNGPACNCGSIGCIEAFASGTALAKASIVPEELGKAIAGWNVEALQVLDGMARQIAAWLGSVISLLDPDVIVLGGGLTQFGEPLFSRLREYTPRRTINRFASGTPIVPAGLRRNTGIIGAAVTVMQVIGAAG